MNLEDRITELLPNNTELGLLVYDLKTKEYLIKINDDNSFPLASISKLISVVMALHEENEFEFTTVHKTIANHCNDSYFSILDEFPADKTNQALSELQLELSIDEDNQNISSNVGTPLALSSFLELLAGDFIQNDHYRNSVFHALSKQHDPDGFRFSKDLEWWHMTGGLEGVCNDIGFLHEKYICVGLLQATKPMVWSELEQTLRKIGAEIESYIID